MMRLNVKALPALAAVLAVALAAALAEPAPAQEPPSPCVHSPSGLAGFRLRRADPPHWLNGYGGQVGAQDAPGDGATPAQVFEKRILPIFKSPNPSSCTQCHLAGVDLKNYILPSSEKTFLSLRDQGLVDLDRPAESKILRLIIMGEEQARGAALIKDKVRKAEYEAFAEWIKACCADPKLRDAPKLKESERAQPKRPNEVIRHARTDRLAESFERNVWSQRQRCYSCHHPQGAGADKTEAESGREALWMRDDAAATMRSILDAQLIDLKAPDRSLLVTKPTNQVKHGGGQKMLVGDIAYKGFREWIEDYAKIAGDKYTSAKDLPKTGDRPDQFSSKIRLKIASVPAAWSDKHLQVTVFAWDAGRKAWEDQPIAVSDRAVWGKGKLWAHELVLLAPRGSERAKAWRAGSPSLPGGRYLVRVHVDLQGRLARDWKAELGKTDYAGQAEISTEWSGETSFEASQIRR